MSPYIIVDNADPSITYSTGNDNWQPISLTGSYGGSYTVGSDNASSFLTFEGSAISAYGNVVDSTPIEYALDGGSSSFMSTGQFNQSAGVVTGIEWFTLRNVPDGKHTITIKPTIGPAMFDYLLITPSQSTDLDGKIQLVDDGDSTKTSRSGSLSYRGSWTNLTDQVSEVGKPMLGTLSSTKTNGSGITFTFTGASVSVYGAVRGARGTVTSTYSIDNGTANSFSPAINIGNPLSLNTLFFHADSLQNEDHTLFINVTRVTGDQAFYLDYIIFSTSSKPYNSSSSSDPLTPALPAGSKSGSTGDSSNGSDFPSNQRLGLILGLTLGLLALVILGLFYIWRRMEKKSQQRARMRPKQYGVTGFRNSDLGMNGRIMALPTMMPSHQKEI